MQLNNVRYKRFGLQLIINTCIVVLTVIHNHIEFYARKTRFKSLLDPVLLATPTVLLVATFLLSVGAAMSSPPFQAVVPDLVSKPELGAAVALNSLGVNISRAIGPALGSFLLSLAGPWKVFMLNALSVVGVAWVLWRWRPAPSIQRLPPEHFFSAVRSGIRYVHAAPVLRNVLVRTVAFFVFGSAGWALLPLVARRELGLGPAGYGVMLACIGLGAIAGAILLPRLRQRLNADRLMVAASLTFAITMLALALYATSGC